MVLGSLWEYLQDGDYQAGDILELTASNSVAGITPYGQSEDLPHGYYAGPAAATYPVEAYQYD